MGKITKHDTATEAELTGLGGDKTDLINDDQIYSTETGKTLKQSIADGDIGGAVAALNDIGDVTITTPSDGQVLKYQSGTWVNGSDDGGATDFDGLSDVDTTGKNDGDYIAWNSAAGEWQAITPLAIPANLSDLTNKSIDDLDDVSVSGVLEDDVLAWNGSNYVPRTLKDNPNIYAIADAEENSTTGFSVSAGTITIESISPLAGAHSYNFNPSAALDTMESKSFSVNSAFRNKEFKAVVRYSASEDFTFSIRRADNDLVIATGTCKSSKKEAELLGAMPDTDQVYYHIEAGGTSEIIWEAHLDSEVFLADTQIKTQKYRARSFAGYATSTKLPYLSTIVDDEGDDLCTITNDGTDGWLLVPNVDIELNMQVWMRGLNDAFIDAVAITIDESGTLNDLPETLANDKILGYGSAGDNAGNKHGPNAQYHGPVKAGSEIRIHADGRTPTGNQMGVSFIAKKANSAVLITESGLETTTYTPTIEGLGTTSNVEAFWHRKGDRMFISGYAQAGTVSATALSISLPTGYEIDSDKIITSDWREIHGSAWRFDSGTFFSAGAGIAHIFSDGTNTEKVFMGTDPSSNTKMSKTAGNAFLASSEGIVFKFDVPIKGWGATSVVSVPVADKANTYAARITNSGSAAIASQSGGFIASVNRVSTGIVDITFKSGLFSVAPAVTATVDQTGGDNRYSMVQSVTTTSCRVRTESASAQTASDEPFFIHVTSQDEDWQNPESYFIGNVSPYRVAYIKDLKTSGSNAGNASANTVQTRDLTSLEGDTDFVSLSSNQFTLEAGKYIFEAHAPAFDCSRHQAFLYNVTDANYDLDGTSERCDTSGNVYNRSFIEGSFTISASKTFEIRHWTEAARGAGLGLSADGTNNPQSNEVYTQVKITKVT